MASVAGETVFINGIVWTADPARPRAEAVLVRDDRIDYVGTNGEVARRTGAGDRVIDLKGRMLVPGFVESHSHPAVAGLLTSQLQIIGTRTVADVQAALKAYAAAHPDEKVLFGFGFPSGLNTAVNDAGVKGPYRKDLDEVVSDRPVVLIALDAHSAWLNSKALEVAGITKDTPDPSAGRPLLPAGRKWRAYGLDGGRQRVLAAVAVLRHRFGRGFPCGLFRNAA